jgi:Leucine-rich repeat (LRR) protein
VGTHQKICAKEKENFKNQTINLNWMSLTNIPPEIYHLEKKVRILRLVGNKITAIPPETLAPLGGLLKLNLNANKINFLPDVFGKMRFLQELHLAENKLEHIPHSVMRLKDLEILNVAHNKIISLSKAIGRLRGITKLNLSSNVIEDIPKEIGEAKTLRKIDLSNNCIRIIPAETGHLFRLRKLNLNFNKLTKIPETFSQLSSLKMLLLCRNRIRQLPKTLGAVIDVAAEYEKLADKAPIENEDNDLIHDGGSSHFVEKFIESEFENSIKDVITPSVDQAKDKADEQNNKKNGRRLSKKKIKQDSKSPYMLLTGIVSSAVEEGTPLIQKQKLWVEADGSGTDGSGTDSDVDGRDASGHTIAKYQYAKGFVCEIISSSSVVVRLITIGHKNASSILFIPGKMISTDYAEGELNPRNPSIGNTKLGAPKTATQHQHLILTFGIKVKKDEENDAEGEDDGTVGRFMLRLNRSAWLQQKETGAVGKVLASLCLTKMPDLSDVTGDKQGDMDGSKTSKNSKKGTKNSNSGQTGEVRKEEEENQEVLDDEEITMEKQVLVSVVVLLLSKDGYFNTEDILTLYSDVPLPDIPDDVSMDGEAATARHLIQPPTHVSSGMREMMVTGFFHVATDHSEEFERGRVFMQMSALKNAPVTVGILSMLPQIGPDPELPLPSSLQEVEEIGTTKEHKAKLYEDKKKREADRAKLRRISLLMVTGRPATLHNIYACNEERPLIQTIINEPIGFPMQVNKQQVLLDPSRWAKLAGKVGSVAILAGQQLKKGAIKLLEKAVGPQRALEIEEKAAKAADVAHARAIMLRQLAIEKSIAMRHGIGPWAAKMAKASADMRKNIRNRLIETVTGKFQLDDISEDSDTLKEVATDGFGEDGDIVKKVYKSDWKGMLVGGIKSLSKEEVHDLMSNELEEYEKLMESKRLQEEKDIKFGKKKKKKKKKKDADKLAPMMTKPSLLANSLVVLRLSGNRLTEVPETFSYFNMLQNVSLDQNPILSPPPLLANMGIHHIRAYFALRTLRLNQLKYELEKRKLSFNADNISPKAEGVISKDSHGHLTKSDLKAFDAQVDKLVNGQIVLFRYTAKKIVKNLIRVAAKRQHWYYQKILLDFVKLCEVIELESLAFANGFLSKDEIRPWGDGNADVRVFIVALEELFDPQRGNPVSVVKMINERNKLGYDKVGFKWKLRQVEEAVANYKGEKEQKF